MISFSTGLPCRDLIITNYGLCTFKGHNEDGTVDLYMGAGRTFRVNGAESFWRYAKG
jgi:hypothetical protein